MKTLSDFKKRLVVGVKLQTTYHCATNGTRDENGNPCLFDEDKGIREISIVQSNSFALKTLKKSPIMAKGMTKDENGINHWNEFETKLTDSWCQYPKASEFKIIDANTCTIYEQDFRERNSTKLIPVLTYKFV
jgi:hypothetical protein